MATINGTPDDDFLAGTSGDDQINGFGGNDQIVAHEGNDTVDAGDGHDFIRGNEGNDTLLGGNGDDYLDGGAGDDILDGGAGIDRVSYAPSATGGVTVDLRIQGVAQDTGQGLDTLIGIESLSGTRFDDTLTGNDGDNWLWGGSDGLGNDGDDTISALGGNDLVEVGHGDHILDGGTGTDTLSVWGNDTDVSGGLTVSLALQGAAQATGQGSMTLAGFENLSGSKYDDVLSGDGGDNVLAGDQGNDHLNGGAGNDTLYGDGRVTVDTHDTGGSGPIVTVQDVTSIDPLLVDGDDVLEGGDGDDTLVGGGGSDTAAYTTASGAVQVFLGAGSGGSSGAAGEDTLIGIENVTGSAYDDTLLGNGGANVLSGGDGHDYLRGGAGNDILLGNNGDDYLDGGADDDVLDGGAGIDRAAFHTSPVGVHVDLNIQGVAQDTGFGHDTLIGIENLSGTTFDDRLTGNGGDNWIWGEGGNDVIAAGGGNDLVEVGPGNATADGGTGNDTISFLDQVSATAAAISVSLALQGTTQDSGEGLMTLTGFENLSGGIADDFLTGDNGDNVIAGDSGNDFLIGNDGNDTLYGDGRIIVDSHGVGTSGPITTYGDVFLLDAEPDGHDYLRGGAGNDVLNGGGGDDYLDGGSGDDVLNGGDGLDRAAFHSATAGVHVDLSIQGVAQNTLQGMDTLNGIEHLSGTTFADTLLGNGGDNWIWGEGGNDSIDAGAGNDLVEVGPGNAVAAGGTGTDTISFLDQVSAVSAAVTVSLALQGGAQATGEGSMTLTGFENLSGGSVNDTLSGDSAANLIAGDTGNDVLNGGDGDDTLYGDGRVMVDSHGVGTSGPITTYADVAALGEADGNDTLSGGKGNDILLGGGGDDVLTGGQGNDQFVFGAGSGHDRITDFAKKDAIVFDASSGVDSFSDLTLTSVGKDTLITWGTGDSILVEGMKPKQLSASDFSFAPAASATSFAFAGDLHGADAHAAAHAAMWTP